MRDPRGGPLEGESFQLHLHRRIGADGGELARQECVVPVALELGASPRGGHFFDMGVDFVEALPAGEQRLGALLPDPLDPGNVVRRVSPDAESVWDELRRATELLLDLGVRDAPVFHGVVERDVVAHELHEILVGSDKDDVEFIFVAAGQGSHDVVGLEILHAQERNVEGLRHPREMRHLLAQGARHVGPCALVVGVAPLPKRPAFRIPGDGQVVRALVADQLEHHVGESKEGVGGQPRRVAHPADREEGAKGQVRSVDEVEGGSAFRVIHGGKFNPAAIRPANCGRARRPGVDRTLPVT